MALRQITDEVMYEIRGLSGQEYVDTYATKKSEDLPSAEPVKITSEPEVADSGNGSTRRRSSADVLRAAAG